MEEARGAGRTSLRSNWSLLEDGFVADQAKGLAVPPLEKPAPEGAAILPLPGPEFFPKSSASIADLLKGRKSRRKFQDMAIGLDELAFLCWSAEGVKLRREKFTLRTAPSGGARHPLELYVYASKVEGVATGLYRYLPIEHALCAVREGDRSEDLDNALLGQFWNAPCYLFWTAIPYRCEWRYGPVSPKLILLDAGHSCENLYLACEALGLGTCAIGAYAQEELDAWLGIDGEEELALYAAPVGRPAE